jgi:hypothetical protein
MARQRTPSNSLLEQLRAARRCVGSDLSAAGHLPQWAAQSGQSAAGSVVNDLIGLGQPR